ncbi:MAG: tetratricopeptide repeat protein [Acidobacteriaceae bacterium]|nr:tetratricopeptide repeat protein [Acidobacteriaceae bacterium]
MLLAATAVQMFPQAQAKADLQQSYDALARKDYDSAIAFFRAALKTEPANAAIHKDFAYTLLKTGENRQARDEFAAAMKLDPKDESASLEYAFLAFETGKAIEARRTFDALRKSGTPATRTTAEQAFQNIDRPLADGVARWKQILAGAANPDDISLFSAHWELANIAELRDDLPLAADQYEICWHLKPAMSEILLALARVLGQLGRLEDAHAALLAASRSPAPRTAELAREQMDARYPYPYEFLNALRLDPNNVALRRELAFLYLAMHNEREATDQFQQLLAVAPGDEAARRQLDALNHLKTRPAVEPSVPAPKVDSKALGEKSLALGYLADAIRYLQQAHEQNPDDPEVMLKLGWAYNESKDDSEAIEWFDRARHAADPAIAAEAAKAYRNLKGDVQPAVTVWAFPMYSLRWHDLFSYAQIKRTIPLPGLNALNHLISFYVSTRFSGDVKSGLEASVAQPQYLSESSFIFGAGAASKTWHHLTGWLEAGESVNYLPFRRDEAYAIPDYRGGLNFARGFGHLLGSPTSGLFYETANDAIYVSRFDKDWLFYSQHRSGRTFAVGDGASVQTLFNVNFVHDLKNQYWAETLEMGPGVKVHLPFFPANVYFATDLLRGVYLDNRYNPRKPNYNDIRVSLWYAITK